MHSDIDYDMLASYCSTDCKHVLTCSYNSHIPKKKSESLWLEEIASVNKIYFWMQVSRWALLVWHVLKQLIAYIVAVCYTFTIYLLYTSHKETVKK